MKIGLRTRTLLTAAAMTAVAIAPAAAQRCFHGGDSDHSPVMKQMGTEIGTAAAEYWTPKLNDYKVKIDRAMSADDLDALNRLRVRWAMLMEEGLKKLHATANGTGKPENGSVEMELGGSEKNMQEVMEIFGAAKELATRYHATIGTLQSDVLTDIGGFVGTMAERADNFVKANRAAIDKDPGAKEMMSHRSALTKIAADLRTEKTRSDFGTIYDFAIEPLVMLYNGADLKSLLGQAGPIAKPIAGIEIPDISALTQNFPNPASTTTRIVYKVTDASRATTIRLYDSRGTLVATYDQGEQGAGEHQLDVDVSGLASGSYLYHLTLETASGPRVYSKTMQVVH